MANSSTEETSTRSSLLRERVPLFNLLGRLDDSLYLVERTIVVTALAIMVFASFLKVLSDFLAQQESMGTVYAVTFFGFLVAGRVAAGSREQLPDQKIPDIAYSLLWGVAGTFYVWLIYSSTITERTLEIKGVDNAYYRLLAAISSSRVIILHVALTGAVMLKYAWDGSKGALGPKTIFHFVVILVATAGGIWVASGITGTYSWAPKISLVLLLWMAFLGASMATHEGKHLTIDAVKKFIPDGGKRVYLGVSQSVAAAITFAFFYLAAYYLIKRMGDAPEPGEIPDWIKVASVPVSLAIITLRFSAYAIGNFIGAALKIEPEPEPDATEVAG